MMDWMTTLPHPTRPAHTHCADQGQVGWKLHIVDLSVGPVDTRGSQFGSYLRNRSRALCGLRPKHGWGSDMFIDAECSKCLAKAEKLHINIGEIR